MNVLDLSTSQKWHSFLKPRITHYTEKICEYQTIDLTITSVKLIMPTGIDPKNALAAEIDKNFFQGSRSTARSWSLREDAFDLGAEYLFEDAKRSAKHWLLCYAGYSRPTDPILQRTPHISYDKKIFWKRNLYTSTITEIMRTLRRSRTRHLYGVLTASENRPCTFGQDTTFITDAFDGDMLVACRLKQRV